MQERLKSVETKISAALRTEGSAPPIMFTLGAWLAKVLSSEDFDTLDELEREVGEEKANEWLAGVLAGTGKYKDEGDGEVSAA